MVKSHLRCEIQLSSELKCTLIWTFVVTERTERGYSWDVCHSTLKISSQLSKPRQLTTFNVRFKHVSPPTIISEYEVTAQTSSSGFQNKISISIYVVLSVAFELASKKQLDM